MGTPGGGKNPTLKFVGIIALGAFLMFLGLGDMLGTPDTAIAMKPTENDEPTKAYLVLGVLMVAMGILMIIRHNQNERIKRY